MKALLVLLFAMFAVGCSEKVEMVSVSECNAQVEVRANVAAKKAAKIASDREVDLCWKVSEKFIREIDSCQQALRLEKTGLLPPDADERAREMKFAYHRNNL